MKASHITALTLGLVVIIGLSGWMLLHQVVKVSLEKALATQLEAQTRFTGIRLNLMRGRLSVGRIDCLSNDPESASWKTVVLEKVEWDFELHRLLSGETPADLRIDSFQVERVPGSYTWISPLLVPITGQSLHSQWPRWKIRSLVIRQGNISSPADTIELKNFEWQSYELTMTSIRYGEFVFDNTLLTFHWEAPQFRIDHFITHYEDGTITARGRWVTGPDDDLRIEYQLENVPARVFLSDHWKVLFTGMVSGQGNYTGPLLTWQDGESKGTFSATEARLQALPVLENLSLLTGMAGLTRVPIDTARADLHYHQERFDFSSIIIEKNNRLRWEGSLSVLPDQTLEGDTVLGVNIGAADLLPQLRESIFTERREGYDWTPVKISGDIHQPREDLTPRLKQQLQNEAEKNLKESGDLIEKGLERAKEFIDGWMKERPE